MSKLAPADGTSVDDLIAATIPMGRMGERSDIALTCVYLASSAASYVSGDPPLLSCYPVSCCVGACVLSRRCNAAGAQRQCVQ